MRKIQRSRDVGDKWNESDAEEKLPSPEKQSITWNAWPPREPDHTKCYSPREENLPIGNQRDFGSHSFMQIWSELFAEVIEQVAK